MTDHFRGREAKQPDRGGCFAAFLFCLCLAACWQTPALHSAPLPIGNTRPNLPISAIGFPDDVQLLHADTDPTLRIPIAHFAEKTLAGPLHQVTGGYGWFEITRSTIRYAATAPLNVGHYGGVSKETDIGFEYARSEITGLKMDYSARVYPMPSQSVQIRTDKLKHYFAYYAYLHWPLDRKSMEQMQKVDAAYTPLLLEAFQNFDAVVAEFKLRHPAPAPPPVVVAPQPAPTPAPPSPPVIVLIAPAGAAEGRSIEVNTSPLTVQGMAMDVSGLPVVSINGTPAMLRSKDANTAEFWSEPLPLQAGDNLFHITAANSAHADATLTFTVRYVPKAAPVNSKALDEAAIISLLAGQVPVSRVVALVKERGVKFPPTEDNLKIIRAAGGTDELIEAIQQAAQHP
jgi:hypothetical protein